MSPPRDTVHLLYTFHEHSVEDIVLTRTEFRWIWQGITGASSFRIHYEMKPPSIDDAAWLDPARALILCEQAF